MYSLEARHLHARNRLARPDPDDAVVISGMSGSFPNSYNVVDYGEKIRNKMNLCDDDECRFKHTNSEIPKVIGKMFDLGSFDAGFFGIHELQANARDPMQRIILELTHSAILDAGLAPEELVGSKTGVFVANCGFEAQMHYMFRNFIKGNHGILAFSKSMLAQYISYFYKLQGPSIALDTACSSGLYALNEAYTSIRSGKCDRAIVAGSSAILNSTYGLQFARLGVINSTGECRPFDDDASGYTRSESICVLILEKSKDAKRVYANFVHSKTNADGFKAEGITFPSKEMQKCLVEEIYKESGVTLDRIGFFEAHGTGTRIGDLAELTGIDEIFNTPQRKSKPLFVGSVKGNIGHTEPVAALASTIKVLYGMENDIILPNIHYKTPKRGAEGLIEGRLKVATDEIKWPGDAPYCGINSFGFGGANGHVLLRRNETSKKRQIDQIPRLICFSGRTEESIRHLQKFLMDHEINNELISLFHSSYRKRITDNIYRGYSVLSHKEKYKCSSRFFSEEPKYLSLIIGDVKEVSKNAFNEFNQLPIFQQTVEKFMDVLKNNNITLNLFTNATSPLEEFMSNTCIYLGIIDILSTLEVFPTYVTANYFGNFIAAYAVQALPFKETVLSIYKLRNLFSRINFPNYMDIKNELEDIIRDFSKTHKIKYIKSDKNPFEFATLDYFIYGFTNNLSNNIINGIELHIDSNDSQPIKLIHSNFKLEKFLKSLGSLYEMGIELNLLKLYPKCSFPVPRGTPMISPLIKWKHNKKYNVPTFEHFENSYRGGRRTIQYDIKNPSNSYIKGHVVDGRNLFPATGYIMCVVEILANLYSHTSIDQLIFQLFNIKFMRALTFVNNANITLHVSIDKSGNFDVSENEGSVVSGRITASAQQKDILFEIPEYLEGKFTLDRNDIYKELRLRGYNYSGQFCGIREVCGNRGILDWPDNLVAFLDNILQFYVLQKNDRSLYIPTGIEKLTLNIPAHMKHIKNLKDDQGIEVYFEKQSNIIKTKCIEIVGIQATAIPRKKQFIDPTLLSYKFIPNEAKLSLEDALRVNTEIILENTSEKIYKVLEYITEENEPFAPFIEKTFNGHPVVLPDIKIISELNTNFGGVEVVNEPISTQSNNVIFIGTKLLAEPKQMKMALETLVDYGYIISLETQYLPIPDNLVCITKYKIPNGILYLLTKSNVLSQTLPVVHVLRNNYDWLNSLKNSFDSKTDFIIYSENDEFSGIIGFTNCLRRETLTKIYSFFLIDAPSFDQHNKFYKKQLKKRLVINVYKNGQWGTYRHMILNSEKNIETEHCFANTTYIGDINTLKWIAGPLKKTTNHIVNIYYSSINFIDLMAASGKVPVNYFAKNLLGQGSILGLEFSGINQDGERVMGIIKSGAIASIAKYDPEWTWKVPDDWSLEEAATVPVIYATVLYCLKIRVNINRSESILIHSGTGGIGLSAINVALHYGLTVYTTVGTKEKREYLIKTYPQVDPQNIGNSRDTSFEQMIYKRTKGRGVDYVLNSLSEEKLFASVRCLAKNGKILEIGKFDISKTSYLSADFQNGGKAFMGIMLDRVVDLSNKSKIKNIVQHGIDAGFVKPLPSRCFEMNQLQDTFKYIGTGKHIGKVMIKIRNESNNKLLNKQLFSATPRVYFNPNASYVVIGGLGGVGLELVDWMVTRGARNLILCSRNGLKNGYQKFVLTKLKTNGVFIKILLHDITKLDGCLSILQEANTIAPVEGIFNLAGQLRDGIFNNLTATDFVAVNSKPISSILFDEVSRTNCPKLKHFVVFSSFIACGMGNAGQTNYGKANSIMERLCESRKAEGLPGLAIQWGVIGDVGMVANMKKEQNEIIIGGTLSQRITSCINVLDQLLLSEEAVVASMVLAEKTDTPKSDNIVDAVLNVIGIRDKKTVSPHTILPELGMDSMMAVEIKNILERDYDTFLTSFVIKNLTIHELMDIHNNIRAETKSTNIDKLCKENMYNETTYKLLQIDAIKDIMEQKVFYFPGIEGVAGTLHNLMVSTSKNSTCIQYVNYDFTNPKQYIDEFLPIVQNCSGTFHFVAHSIGTIFALELAAKLESLGYCGKLVIIDSCSDPIRELTSFHKFELNKDSENELLTKIFNIFFQSSVFTNTQIDTNYENLLKVTIDSISSDIKCNKKMIFDISTFIYKMVKMVQNYKPNFNPIKSEVMLFTPTQINRKGLPDDLDLSKYCENLNEIYFEGNHTTFIDDPKIHEKIKNFLQ